MVARFAFHEGRQRALFVVFLIVVFLIVVIVDLLVGILFPFAAFLFPFTADNAPARI